MKGKRGPRPALRRPDLQDGDGAVHSLADALPHSVLGTPQPVEAKPGSLPGPSAGRAKPSGKSSKRKSPAPSTPAATASPRPETPVQRSAGPPAAPLFDPPASVRCDEAGPRQEVHPASKETVHGSDTVAGPAKEKSADFPDFDRLAHNMGLLMEQGSRVAASILRPRDAEAPSASKGEDVVDMVSSLGRVASYWLTDPARAIRAQTSLSSQFVDLWIDSLARLAGNAPGKVELSKPTDKRFADPEWRQLPVFDFLRQAYLISTDWANSLVEDAEDIDGETRDKARFYLRQVAGAVSPSNFLFTNPELLRETLKQNGENLVRGMRMLAEDIEAGGGELKIRQSDPTPFKLGVNMAVTPGKVVFRNELMELLQYAPTTPEVYKRPLLIVPPWINKFYVLDLNPEKSFIRWAVEQGLTVFVISWVNPDERHAEKGFEAYMRDGILSALSAIEEAAGERDVTAIGYCVGGTLLAVTLAYMAAREDRRISSATFFAAQTDFQEAGDLKIFAGEDHIRALEAQMKQDGYLKGGKMANAFNMLRPNELIWSYVVDNYLKGKAPPAFDLLTWNSDATRMPAANHAFYLRNCYLGNKLTKGEMVIGGEQLDLKKVALPVYNLATREDHIAPARSVFTGAKFFGGPMRFVLAGSGHIAGVVNPPSKGKYGYAEGPPVEGRFEDWLAAAVQHPGSWWPDWLAWLTAQAPERVPARIPGAGRRPALGDAPGDYVRVQS